jgi:hypothetical protein
MEFAHRFEEMSRPMHSADGIARAPSDSRLPPKSESANVSMLGDFCPEQPWQFAAEFRRLGVFVAPIW